MKNTKNFSYYLAEKGKFNPFIQYESMSVDEILARQLARSLVFNELVYIRHSNGVVDGVDTVFLLQGGSAVDTDDSKSFRSQGIYLEIRSPKASPKYPLIARISCQTHCDVLQYLIKDVVEVPAGELKGQYMRVVATEIDDDRGVYVLYVDDYDQ